MRPTSRSARTVEPRYRSSGGAAPTVIRSRCTRPRRSPSAVGRLHLASRSGRTSLASISGTRSAARDRARDADRHTVSIRRRCSRWSRLCRSSRCAGNIRARRLRKRGERGPDAVAPARPRPLSGSGRDRPLLRAGGAAPEAGQGVLLQGARHRAPRGGGDRRRRRRAGVELQRSRAIGGGCLALIGGRSRRRDIGDGPGGARVGAGRPRRAEGLSSPVRRLRPAAPSSRSGAGVTRSSSAR